MPKEFPTIIIPCQSNQPDMEPLLECFSRTDLHVPPKRPFGPYSNPNGKDKDLLLCKLTKEVGGNVPEDAYRFFFDFKVDKAVFLFDPNKVQAIDDRGSFEFELTGNYNFRDKIRICWKKGKSSLINVIPLIDGTSYVLGSENTTIGDIEVSPKSKPCQDQIIVKIILDENLNKYLEVENEIKVCNGEPKIVTLFIKKDKFKHLPQRLIKGSMRFHVESHDGNEVPIEIAIGEASCTEQYQNINRVTLKEVECLDIINGNDDDDLFNEENPVIVYINQEPKPFEIRLTTTLPKANAKFELVPARKGGNALVASEEFDKKIPLEKGVPKTVSVFIVPDGKEGISCQLLKLSADYSSPCEKKVYVKTKEQEPPNGHLVFDFTSVDEDDVPNPYYKGNGKEKVGILKVINESPNNEQYRQVLLPPTCTCPFVTIEPLEKSVKAVNANETASYNVYIDIPESEAVETDEDNNLNLEISCDGLDEITKTLPVHCKEPELIDIRFFPESNIVYSPDEKILVGYLKVQYTRENSRCYINRNEKLLTLEDSGIVLIADKKKGSKLAIENGDYPVFYDCAVKHAGKKNIDENEHVILNLNYSDSIEKDREIPIEFEICPIEANPQPNVCVTCEEEDDVIWEDGEKKVEVWTLQFDSRARNNIHSAIIGHISFFNKQNIPYKNSELSFKQIELKGNYLRIETDSEISLPNGGDAQSYPIQIIYDNLPVSDDITTELSIKYEVCVNGEMKTYEASIPIQIREIVVDDWYSLDLGTTGIVVAKWTADNPDETTCVQLQDDTSNAIEQESTIASSKTILMDNGEDEDYSPTAVCAVHPNKLDLKQKATFVLVPSKFFAGQAHVPFAKSYREKYSCGLTIGSSPVSWEDAVPKLLLQHTYKTIFDMVGEDCRCGIRKLIVTYPNTYTPSSLTWLRGVIIPDTDSPFPLLTSNNLHFIPESDAVVAFYINQQINGATSIETREKIVIYDMGAGTLDLSYVEIESRKGKRCATIQKRIGIPIAGDFLSFLLYKQIEDNISANTSMHTTREFVETIKSKFSTTMTYSNLKFKDSVFTTEEILNNKMEIGDELKGWIEICSDVIFRLLLGEEWEEKVEKVVFSGRGSQFAPLRINLEKKIGKEKLDDMTISPDSLKQCVAKGALLYQRIFENDNMPFSIVHKNTYQNIGFRYRVLNNKHVREWRYKEIVGERDYIWDEIPINGAYHAIIRNKSIMNLDLSEDADVTFYITPLSKNEMEELLLNPDDNKWCFVNQLFTFNPGFLASSKRKDVKISISIDKNNQLSIKLDDKIDLLQHTTAPNIEENRYFTLCYDYINKK